MRFPHTRLAADLRFGDTFLSPTFGDEVLVTSVGQPNADEVLVSGTLAGGKAVELNLDPSDLLNLAVR